MPKRRSRLGTALLLACCVSGILLGSDAGAGTGCGGASLARCVVGSASSSGNRAAATATGTAAHPTSFSIVLYTSTPQRVLVVWTFVCRRGFRAGSKSGSFITKTGSKAPPSPTGGRGWWALSVLPKPLAKADECIVSANAQQSGAGSLEIQIVALR